MTCAHQGCNFPEGECLGLCLGLNKRRTLALQVEADPTGRKPNEPGAKLDAGKVRPDLVLDGFSQALLEVARVATYGAQKYSENGWMQVPDGIKRYRAAGDRHRLRRCTEDLDPDTGVTHLAHEAWNRLAELELLLRGDHVP